MRVTVIGHSGFIGTNLIRILRQEGHVALPFHGDITSPEDRAAIFANEPHAVVNLSAYGNDSSHSQTTPDDIAKSYEVNIVGPLHLAYLCERHKVIFINAGSSSEYGIQSKPLTTQSPLLGETPYAQSKALMSRLLRKMGNPPTRMKTVRIFSCYGPHEKPNRLIPTAFAAAMSGEPMRLSPGVHDFVFVDDVCRDIIRVMESPYNYPQIIHSATGIQTTNSQVIKLIEKITQSPIFSDLVDTLRIGDGATSWVSGTVDLTTSYKKSLEEGLRLTWSWIQDKY